MTKARDTANIVGGGFSGTIAGATMEPTGDTAAGDNAAIGFTAAEGLILTGQGSTGDVTIKNDADALVAHVPTGTTGITFAGDVIVPDGDLILGSTAVTATGAEINLIDGGTARGTTAVADGDGFLTNDGGTMRMTKVDTLATYIGTKVGGGLEFISSTDISSAATFSFTGFDASKYDNYKLFFSNLTPANDGVTLTMVTSTDGGTNYDTGDSDYSRARFYMQNSYGNFVSSLNNQALNEVAGAFGTASGEEGGGSGEITIFGPHLAQFTQIQSKFFFATNGGLGALQICGFARSSAADVTAVKFAFTSGAIASGTFTAYGMVNS